MCVHTHTHTHTHVQTFLLEKYRVAQRSEMEGNFNIFYQLIAGADDQLTADLLLNIPVESEENNLYIEPYDDVSGVCVCVCVCMCVCVLCVCVCVVCVCVLCVCCVCVVCEWNLLHITSLDTALGSLLYEYCLMISDP